METSKELKLQALEAVRLTIEAEVAGYDHSINSILADSSYRTPEGGDEMPYTLHRVYQKMATCKVALIEVERKITSLGSE